MLWPLGMMLPFIDVRRVIRGIIGWTASRPRIMVVAGDKDTLMGVTLMAKMAAAYQRAWSKLFPIGIAQESTDDSVAVRFEVIKGSGHHVQNDLPWEVCAGKILDFMEQL